MGEIKPRLYCSKCDKAFKTLRELQYHQHKKVKKPKTYGTSGGVLLTEKLIEKLADEAERGYDINKIRRGRIKKPSVSRSLRYFCLECKQWHLNSRADHLKFKRTRGRPKK